MTGTRSVWSELKPNGNSLQQTKLAQYFPWLTVAFGNTGTCSY
jgi:hypothetical protein